MSADLSPGRPTEQEWADQVRLAIPAMLPGYPERIAAALAPLIARVEEAAKAEERERIAQAIEVEALADTTTSNQRAAYRSAARIAREAQQDGGSRG